MLFARLVKERRDAGAVDGGRWTVDDDGVDEGYFA